jgi:hypothetical protein
LKSLVYSKSIKLGKEAFEEGLQKIAEKGKEKEKGRGQRGPETKRKRPAMQKNKFATKFQRTRRQARISSASPYTR